MDFAKKALSFWVVLAIFLVLLEPLLIRLDLSSPVQAAPGDGRMLLLWDGGAAPSGWTCVSCSPGDDFYQIFPRGSDTYGATGGSSSHGHTTANSLSGASGAAVTNDTVGTTTSILTHTHSLSVSLGTASNLPSYRQLQIIRHNTSGEPATIPAGAIGMFDGALPSGWSAYSSQNSYYVRGESTSGTTGGSNTHNHSVGTTIGAAAGLTYGVQNGGARANAAGAAHTHTASGSSSTVNQEPPYIEVMFGQISSDDTPPDGLLAMWDDEVPDNWSMQSHAAGPFYQRFLKGSASYGSAAGATSHSHVNTVLTTSGSSSSVDARASGTLVTASAAHTHTVTLSNYSSENQLPPFRDVMIAKKVPESMVAQSAYRVYRNTDSTDVGSVLGAQNTPTTSTRQGQPFRMRMLLSVSDAVLGIGNKNFKLQYAQRSGTCDVSFSGETFSDVSTSSGEIRFHNNGVPNDGDGLTPDANDPTSPNTIIDQTYEESNNFTTTAAVAIGEDGMWDFALIDNSAPASTNYCFRVVYSDGSLLDSYVVVPEVISDDGNGHMILMYDGGSIPSGWSCVSCDPSDDFYQRFFRGASSYGATGGSATHSHIGSTSVGAPTTNTTQNTGAGVLASSAHSHSASVSIGNASNLPQYRQLKIIRANTSGVPSVLPTGAIAMFDASLPSGWTAYSAQNGNFIRGENTAGTTGGSATHTHPITGSLSSSTGGTSTAATNGTTQSTALDGHTHNVSGVSTSNSSEPPYLEAILASLDSSASVPQGIVAIWDGPMPGSWTNMSNSGQPFENRFVKASATYGPTGGSASHSHGNSTVASGTAIGTGTYRTGTGTSAGAHTHDVTVSSISTEASLPPYIDVIIGSLTVPNNAPDTPFNLDQLRTSDNSSINVGDFTNGGQVEFVAEATDDDNPDDVQLCVEVVPLASSFTGTPNSCGSLVTYSGAAVSVSVTVSGLVSGTSYHWQAQVKDGSGGVSSWVSFGGNAESAADFIDDSTAPSGIVYDGTTLLADVDFNDGSLDELSANWDIDDNESGIGFYEFAVGTTSGGNDIVDWTNIALVVSYSATSLTLETSDVYFVSIRANDNAGNDATLTSDGQQVAPSLTFSTSGNDVTFDGLNPGNSYTDTETTTLTTSTNARSGYIIRARATGLLENILGDSIPMFSGGTYATPDEWLGGDLGYGYHSSDILVQGINKFNPAVCAGGGNGPCYAPFTQSIPGDIVADNTGPVSGTPISNESFTITHRVSADPLQNPGRYETVVIFSATATY